MSIQAIEWALSQPIKSHGKKLLLVAIADYADETGLAWPGQRALQEKVLADRKSLIAWLRDLEESGLVTVKRRGNVDGGRSPNAYQLHLELSPAEWDISWGVKSQPVGLKGGS